MVKEYKAFDFETTGLNPYIGDRIFSYCIADCKGNVFVGRFDGPKYEARDNWKRLRDFFLDDTIGKIAHNLIFEKSLIRRHAIEYPETTEWHDTLRMSQLFRNLAPNHKLEYLGWELGKIPMDIDLAVKAQAKARGGYQFVDKPLMHEYQILDGIRCMWLFRLWWPKIQKEVFFEDYLNEVKFVDTTERMQQYGLDVCIPETEKLIVWLEDELERVQDSVFKTFGEYINLNSTDQVARLLYQRLKMPILEYTESNSSGIQRPSTGKDALLKLRKSKHNHPVIELIFKQRSYTKGLAIVKSYKDLASKESRIHANILGNAARTGRLSCKRPNLMNVSKDEVEKNPYTVPARKCFKVRQDCLMGFVDYVGLQMMLIIELAQCTQMQEIIRKGGHPHIEAARIFYGKHLPPEMQFINKKQSKKLYGAAKNGHFGLAFGSGFAQFADAVNLTHSQARPGYDEYCELYPEIKNLSTTTADEVKSTGYVLTPFGRKLYVAVDKAYAGLNYKIQGTEAGITKRALIGLDDYFKTVWKDEIRLVIPIHDEIVFSFPRYLQRKTDRLFQEIKEVMTNIPQITTPLDVEFKVTSSTWDRAK